MSRIGDTFVNHHSDHDFLFNDFAHLDSML